ncbi:hypothetical protein AAGW05_05870 [Arthrobacter sp. LAPM80]|uniref:hypothetical protein n=1 Tax=Arthrobacter sp. LAPM80 TaxID=3141788 RepID=UPI00398B8847
MSGDSIDTVVHVESDKVKVLLQPRTLSAWFALAQDPAIDGAVAELDIIADHTRQPSTGTAYVLSRTMDSEDHLMVRPEAGAWAVGRAMDPASDVVEQTGLSRDELPRPCPLCVLPSDHEPEPQGLDYASPRTARPFRTGQQGILHVGG